MKRSRIALLMLAALVVGSMMLVGCGKDDGPEADSEFEQKLKQNGVPEYSVMRDLLSKDYKEVEESLKKFGYTVQSRSPQNDFVSEVRVNMYKAGDGKAKLYYEFAYIYKTGKLKYIGFEYDDLPSDASSIISHLDKLIDDEVTFQGKGAPEQTGGLFSGDCAEVSITSIGMLDSVWRIIKSSMQRAVQTNPTDRRYTSDGLWVKRENDTQVKIGITDFTHYRIGIVAALGNCQTGPDTIFKGDLAFSAAGFPMGGSAEEPTQLDFNMPLSGIIEGLNNSAINGTEVSNAADFNINIDPYGEGWVMKVKPVRMADIDNLLSADSYKSTMVKKMRVLLTTATEYRTFKTNANFNLNEGELIFTKRVTAM